MSRGFLVSWFQSCLVSKFLRFMLSWFQHFLISLFLGFKVSKIYQISVSCFQEAIVPISQIFRFCETDRRPSFPSFKSADLQNSEASKKHMFQQRFWVFLDCLSYPGVSKDNNCWFWGSWTRPKIQKS